jgi:hypothetical protein
MAKFDLVSLSTSSNNDETNNKKQNTKKVDLVAKEESASSIRPLQRKIQSSQHGRHSALHIIHHLNLRAAASGDNSRANASCSHLTRVKQRRRTAPQRSLQILHALQLGEARRQHEREQRVVLSCLRAKLQVNVAANLQQTCQVKSTKCRTEGATFSNCLYISEPFPPMTYAKSGVNTNGARSRFTPNFSLKLPKKWPKSMWKRWPARVT